MADTKITALSANTDPQASDLVSIIDDPAGSPENKKVEVGNLMATKNLYALMTPPSIGDFAWINQGTATTNTGNWGINIASAALAGDNFRILKKSAPGTPYAITICAMPLLHEYNTQFAGVCFRASGSGSLVVFGMECINDRTQLVVQKWTDSTTFSADYKSQAITAYTGRLYLKIEDTGANRICSWGVDGVNYLEYHSVGRTDFITADEVGMAMNVNHGTRGCQVTYTCWMES